MPTRPLQRRILRFCAGLLVACCLAGTGAAAAERASLIHTPPVGARAGRALELEGTLLSGSGVERLIIRYRVAGGSWREAPMELAFGDLFRGTIPGGFLTHGTLEYHIEGVPLRGQRVEVFASREDPARVVLGGGRAPRTSEPEARDPEPAPRKDPSARAGGGPRRTEPAALTDEELEWRALEARTDPPAPSRTVAREANSGSTPAREPPVPAREPRTPEPEPARPARGESGGDTDWAQTGTPGSPSGRTRSTRPGAPRPERTPFEDELAVYAATDEAALARIHAPAAITTLQPTVVLTRSDLRRLGVRRVHEALEYVPGLTVTRDVQGYWRTAIRGLRGEAEVLFLRDGIRLNNAWDGRALADMPVENLERIEITLGPGAARFGGPAVLGIIQLFSRTDPGVRGAVSGGSFGTFDGHADAVTQLGPVQLRADLDVLGQEGYRAELATDEIGELTEAQGLRRVGDPVGFTDDRRFLAQGGVGAHLELPGGGSLSASGRLYHEDRGVLAGQFNTAANTDPGGDDPSRIGSLGLFGRVDWRQPLGEAIALRAGLWAQQQSSQRLYQLAPGGFMTSADPASAFVDGVREQQDFGVRDLGLELGLEVELGSAHAISLGVSGDLQQLTDFASLTNYDLAGLPLGGMERALEGTDGTGAPILLPYPQERSGGLAARRLGGAVWLEDRWRVLERLELDAGLRVEAWELPVADAQGGFSGTRWVPSLNPRLGVAVQLSDPLVLRAGWARAFRAPTMSELGELLPHRNLGFGRGRAYGNPGLQPANLDTLSASADLLQSAGFSRIRLRGEAFFSYLSGAITMVDRSGSDTPWTNRTAVRVFGAEGEAVVEISERARAFLNVSISRAEDMDTPAGFRLLTDVSQARFAAGATVPVGAFLNLDLSARLGAERRNTARSELELLRRFAIPGYGLVTAQLRTEPLFGHLEVVLLGQNLMDARVTDDVPRADKMTGLLPREGFSAFLLVRGWL